MIPKVIPITIQNKERLTPTNAPIGKDIPSMIRYVTSERARDYTSSIAKDKNPVFLSKTAGIYLFSE